MRNAATAPTNVPITVTGSGTGAAMLAYPNPKLGRARTLEIFTGDTKVVDRGKGNGLFINTSGVGILEHPLKIVPSSIQSAIPVLEEVQGACELLGLDPRCILPMRGGLLPLSHQQISIEH